MNNNPDYPKLETERLCLRPPQEKDFEAYEEFFSDAVASEHYGGPLPAQRIWSLLAADLGHFQLRGYGRWALFEKSGSGMVGSCGLWAPLGWPRAELTWWLSMSARGKGYATEASLAVIGFAVNTLGWDHVETHMNDDNKAAYKLMSRLGGQLITREVFPDGVPRNVFQLPRS
jgi:RimJ/RimL family protein N-acetyltransferase